MRIIKKTLVMLCVFVLGYIIFNLIITKSAEIESQYTLEVEEIISTVINVEPDYSKFVTVTDKEGNKITNIELLIFDDVLNINEEGIYPIAIAIYDEEINDLLIKKSRVKVINDDEPPIINIKYDKYYFEKNKQLSDNDFIVTVTDNYDENPIVEFDYNNINTNKVDKYKVNIKAYDSSGNESIEEIDVIIVEKIPEVIKNAEIEFEVFDNLDLVKYLDIDDFYDDNLIIEIINNDEFRSDIIGEYNVEFKTSFYNISSTKTIKVNVVDNTKPQITGVKKINIEKGSIFNWDKYFTYKDNYDKKEDLNTTLIGDYNVDKEGEYNLTLSVEDLSGNINQYSFILIVESKNNSTLLWVSIIFGLITISSIGTFYYLRKTKENEE